MARLRFPGRPGHRFDRLSLKYFADDIKNSQDPSLAFLPQFQHGLKSFRDIVGVSDEEDDFEGFTAKELKDGERKLHLFNKEEQKKKETEVQLLEMGQQTEGHGKRLGKLRVSLKSLPAPIRPGVKMKHFGKSDKSFYEDKEMTVGKDKIPSLKLRGSKIFDHRKKPKKFKLDYKHGLHDTKIVEEKSKKSDMDMAKFLLEKAKQANKLQEQAKARRLAASKKVVQVQRREFVLPMQSSRSSRVIKPNKRFLESDSVNTVVIKKSKPDDFAGITPEKEPSSSFKVEERKSLDSFHPSFSGSPNNIGLLDQPLIVDGKRDRKPSLKLQMSDDEVPLFSPTKSAMTSPLAAPKLGTSLFSQSQFQKASEKQKFSMMGFGASRLHGTSIVQKAKLQLNRAALNKSKAALARSLKAEMNREANFAEQVKQHEADTSADIPDEPVKEIKRRRRKYCSVCGKKNDLTICYDKITACSSCKRFYKECNWLINAGTFTKPNCMKNEKCKLRPDRMKCRYCRIKKVLQVGFPALPQLTELFEEQEVKKVKVKKAVKKEEQLHIGTPVTEELHIDVESFSPAPKKSGRKSTPVHSPVPVIDISACLSSPPQLPSKSITTPLKEQELSPLKAGEGSEKRQRKKRAFKELLRNKQDKEKEEEAESVSQQAEKPIIPEPIPVVATGSVEISPRGGPGPRIKHVCRNAAVVLGQPLATFPEKSELRLSALPTKEKVQLWKKDEESKAANEDSDDERPMEEIIQQSGDSVVIMKKSPARPKIGKKLTGAGGLHLYKRKMRCRKCPGCVRQDCGTCRHCLDKPKFGGQGVLKQGCLERRCTNPLIQRSATEAFIVEKKKNVNEPRVEQIKIIRESDEPEDHTEGQSDFVRGDNKEPVIPGSEVTQTVFGLETQTGTLVEDETQSNNNESEKPNENISSERDNKPVQTSSQQVNVERQRATTRAQTTTTRGHSSEVRKLTFEDIPNFQLERISSRNKEPGKMSSKLMKKLEMQQKYSKKEGGNDGQCYPVTLESVLPASRQWGSLLSQPKYYPIKVDFKGKCDLGSAWNYGMALTMSNAMSVRALCFLCGSAGKHEMIYCNICCEPFHEFCLEDWEQPAPDHYDDWICAACQFCHVCGRQNNLLQCDKCQNTYHPGCLGPNYPTKPSKRKNIWICTKCVKCKSCGATTPGSDSQATWTYDFSLCHECGQLMDKGNFCPICRKCYSDDDWESKMIQCNMCESWVHSKCEGLTDEMYEILSYLPEDLSFYCRKCFPVGCPEWESTLKRELRQGLENILQSLILSKSSQYILKQEKKSPPKQQVLPSHQTPEKQNKSCALKNTVNTETSQNRVKRNFNRFEKIKELLNGGKSKELTNGIDRGLSNDNKGLPNGDLCDNGCQGDRRLEQTCEKEINTLNNTNSRENHVAMETEDYSSDKLLSQTNDIIGDGADLAKHVIDTVNNEDTKRSCDNDKPSEGNNSNEGFTANKGSPVIGDDPSSKDYATNSGVSGCGVNDKLIKVGHDKGIEEDKPVICDKQTVCDANNDPGCENTSTGTVDSNETNQCDNTSDVNALTTASSECSKNEISKAEGTVDDVKRTEGSQGVVIHSAGTGKQSNVIDQNFSSDQTLPTGSGQNLLGVDNKLKNLETKIAECKTGVVQRKNSHVHFSIEESNHRQSTEKKQEKENNFPKDLMEIAQKMKYGEYKSVAVFCEDILHVIQTYLDNEEESRTSRKKATQSAKSIFAKQLEKVFPWFNVKTCRHWYSMQSLPDGMLADATLPPNMDHTYAQWLERIEVPRSPQPSPFKRRTATPVKKYMPIDEEDYEPGQMFEGDDERKCMFCQTFGDQEANDAGRLLYCGQDDWCHINCALWSAEVYEDVDGELQNIVEAFSRGKMLRCDMCGKAGATVGCNTKGCKSNYHFMCARRDQCRFQEDKKVFCKNHRMYIDAELLTGDRFNVLRRAHVGTLFVRSIKKRWSRGLHCGDVSVLMGSCCVENLGRLTDLSDKPKFLQPVDFITTRMYWSTKDARRRCVYTCRIVEVRPEAMKSPTITIKDMRIVHDQNHPDFVSFSNLDLAGINSVTEQENLSILGTDSENPLVDLTSNTADITTDTADMTAYTSQTVDMSETLSAEEHTMEISYNKGELSLNQKTDSCFKKDDDNSNRRASFSGRPTDNTVSKESDKLSLSWPISSAKSTNENLKSANLSFLSPQTLKMLNIKDPSQFIKPVKNDENVKEDEEEFSLLKVANRLNKAAAKSSRRSSEGGRSGGSSPLPLRANSRSPSVERGCSPLLTRPFSPIIGVRQRSQSVDRNTEIKPSLNQHTKFSSLLASLPEKPFTPPSRMLSRSKSLSLEKETLLSKSSSNNVTNISNEPFLPAGNVDSPECSRRGRSVSDPENYMPEPVSFSSPVVRIDEPGQNKFNLSDQSTDIEDSKNLNTSLFSNSTSIDTVRSVTETTNTDVNEQSRIDVTENETSVMITDSDVIDSSQNIDTAEETTETIVVMTESGESLSEEDAIKIVQDMIEQRNSSFQTEDQDFDVGTENDNSTATENMNENCKERDEYAENKCEVKENEEESESPFIPQIEAESIVNERVRRHTGDKRTNNVDDENECEETDKTNDDKANLPVLDKFDSDTNEGKEKDVENSEEMKVIILDSVSDGDSDITDITDSIVKSDHARKLVESEADRNRIIEKEPHENCESMNVESCDKSESSATEISMKRIVYDLDESIDSDIELLDDLDATENNENDCNRISENVNNKDTENSVSDVIRLENSDMMSAECSDNATQSGNSNEEQLVDTVELENKICRKDDEIDGDTVKINQNIEDNMKQLVSTALPSEIEKGDSTLPKSSDMKTVGCVSQSGKEDIVLIQKSLQQSEKIVTMDTIEDKQSIETENSDENLDSSKEEVLRGLGLGTFDEVEKLKNSPQKSPSLPVLTFEKKRKCSKTMPVKSYPLRKHMTSPNRIQEQNKAKLQFEGSSKDEVDGSKDSDQSNKSKDGKEVIEIDKNMRKELSPELPVLDPIAKKIKEESIAKSCPEDKGPFKCSKCRRQYRTETSYLVHIENCNFLVSSSDDEDINHDDEDGKVKAEGRRNTRSRVKSLNEEKDQRKESFCSSDDNTEDKRTTLRRSTQYQRVAIEVEKRQQEEENPKRGRGRPPFKHKDSLESDKEKHQKELMSRELFSNAKDDEPCVAEGSEVPIKKGRGRPRKSEIIVRNIDGDSDDLVFEGDKVSQRENRRKSRETKILENMSQSSDSEQDIKPDQETNLVKRKRGRPRKITINSEADKLNSSGEKQEAAKITVVIEGEKQCAKDGEHDTTVKCADFQKVKDHLKSQIDTIRKNRYRPAKMVHMKTKNKTIRLYIKDRKKSRDGHNKFGLKSVSIRLHKTDCFSKNKETNNKDECNDKTMEVDNDIVMSTLEAEDADKPVPQENVTSKENKTDDHSDSEVVSRIETQEASNQTDKSSDEEGDILDESTGWIIDKKTGEMIRSPTQKNPDDDDDQRANETLDEISMSDENADSTNNGNNENNGDNASEENNGDNASEENNGDYASEENNGDNISEENNENNASEENNVSKENNANEETDENQESKDVFRFNSPEAKEKKFDEIDNCIEMEDEKTEPSTESSSNEMLENPVQRESADNNEVKAVNEQGAIKSMELKDFSDNLPNTVLKLLKEGHKVVIKNPKLNKCFMWQKTPDGYIGKPFNKDLAKSPSVSEKPDKGISEHNPNSLNKNNVACSVSVSKDTKIQSASDILQERKKLEGAQRQTKQVVETVKVSQYKEQATASQDMIKRKAKFVAENIERLIETNLIAKARSAIPERLPKGSAEYVGGILISPPKSATADELKQAIQKTAPLATNMLQNKLNQNKVINNYQTSVQHMQGNFLSSSIQPAIQSPVPVVSHSHTLLQQQLQASNVGMLVQTDLQGASQTSLQTFQQVSPQQSITPAGYMQSLSPVNQQYTAQLVTPSVIQQTYQPVQVQQVQQIPAIDVGMINVPLMTSVGFSNNAQLVQALGTINHNSSQQYLSANTPLVNAQSSPLMVNPQMSQSLLNTHSPQTLMNQYINQPMLSPQPASSVISQFTAHAQSLVNQLSAQSVNQLSTQSEAAKVNQFGSQISYTPSLLNQPPSLVTVSQTNTNQYSTSKMSFSKPCVFYNKTQIVNKPSGNEGSNHYSSNNANNIGQNSIIKTHSYSVLKQKLASESTVEKREGNIPKTIQFFNTRPGLGGGSTSLLNKMQSYLALKHKLPAADTNSSPKCKKMKQTPVVRILDNGITQVSMDGKSSPKKQKHKVKKRLKVKAKVKKELSPSKWRRPHLRKNPTPNISSGIALPHKPDKASHPMIHGPKEVTSLPVAAVEEEVRDVPLTAFDDNEGRQPGDDGMCHNLGHLEFEITSDDGFMCRSDTLDGAWKQVTEKVQDARTASRLKHLSYAGLTGVQMFGLSHPSVVYLVEQLYGASYCRRYKFKYHRHEIVERELELVNPTGCIRTEPFSGRNPTDMFSFLMSRYRTLPENCGRDINEEIAMKSSRRATSMDLPMAMRFRKLKNFSKECVGVYRSTIHGRGLFCKRNIDAGEMIIEYAGEVIRNSMTDIREKYYESKGIGCYMFRIDDLDVVDATMRGSAARFINHSCDGELFSMWKQWDGNMLMICPNCYSKVINVDNRKHIVIFAMRKILRGEELTYDYKFPIEEIKIPCTCGAKRCRRYLN